MSFVLQQSIKARASRIGSVKSFPPNEAKIAKAVTEDVQDATDKAPSTREEIYLDNISKLDVDRRNTSVYQIELSLETIANLLAREFDKTLFIREHADLLARLVASGKTPVELIQASRAVSMLVLLRLERSADFIASNVLPEFYKAFVDTNNDSAVRATLMVFHATLLYYLNADNSGFGLESEIEKYLELLDTESESPVFNCGILLSVGLLLSATASRNSVIEDTLPMVYELLSYSDPEVKKAAGMLIAQMYEQYDFSEQDDEDFYRPDNGFSGFKYEIETVDNFDMIAELEGLLGATHKTVAKRAKQDMRLEFRRVLATVESRLVALDKDREHTKLSDDEASLAAIAGLKLGRGKIVPIRTWAQLNLSYALKLLYGDGVVAQITGGHNIIRDSLLAEKDDSRQYRSVNKAPATDIFETSVGEGTMRGREDPRKSISIKRAREEKERARQFNEEDY
ncbi:hypothetical protein DV495_001720 [Geotrichum candidum]|uniref:Interferon-related developmental regulator N-terminal domain-containing protein n=1 Tax=Geotrichum candidum TaxID=1173061 RepID=A0A0J9XGA2_GEOCN|nr:hypothetical protein DV452_003433 [Geotrichum candidum]KAI9210682.1 hypothetical protein DS838_004440 [Geotrichum bryndzae]KAF5132011.1 hypothetical protein DV495_001720 [Geotrichum candidum]KAF7497659.1 hypothetical protein DV113_004316 [Geotrichum candidum]KAI8132107.1 hypothetical protein DUD61_004210 [Geotrichum candidum]